MMSKNSTEMSELLRTTSCVTEPEANLALCIVNNELTKLVDLLNEDLDNKQELMDRPLADYNDNTLLMLAIEQGNVDIIKALIEVGNADVNCYNKELKKMPIHTAATYKKRDTYNRDVDSATLLRLLISMGADINAKAAISGRTALHIVAERGDLDAIKTLVAVNKLDVDVHDKKGRCTPLYLAVKNNQIEAAKLLIENGADKNHVCFGKSIEQLANSKNIDLNNIKRNKAPLISTQISSDSINKLIEIVDHAGLNGFMTESELQTFQSLLLQVDVDDLELNGFTLLQRLAQEGLDEGIKVVLENHKIDINASTKATPIAPVLLAARQGHYKVLSLLKEHGAAFDSISRDSQESILHVILRQNRENRFEKCLKIVLSLNKDDLSSIINKKDRVGNTALHYATELWPQEVVRALLELGANVGVANYWEDMAISKIPSETMESFLDEFCIDFSGDVHNDDFAITFDYTFLAPPLEHALNNEDKEQGDAENRSTLPETQVLWYMSHSSEHQRLLLHPVVTSFLHFKWLRIRRSFNCNLRFYFLFVFVLTWNIFHIFGHPDIKTNNEILILNHLFVLLVLILIILIMLDWKQRLINNYDDDDSKSLLNILANVPNWFELIQILLMFTLIIGGHSYLKFVLLLLLLALATRELFQMAVSLKRYIFSIENYVELTIIAIVLLLFAPFLSIEDVMLKRHLAAVVLVLSWAELFTMVGKHPALNRLNVYVLMFYRVLATFGFFLSWYAFFIIAFGLAFYIMLHKNGSDVDNVDNAEDVDSYVYFDSVLLSLVKTSTMFVGELEFSDIPVDLDSWLMPFSYLIFLSFVFFIVVVLMNLLNGLAVSDTALIQEKAEIMAISSKVETISYAESVLLGDPLNFLNNWPALRSLRQLPSCSVLVHLYSNRIVQKIMNRLTGAKDILLFYKWLPEKKFRMRPNKRSSECQRLNSELMPLEIVSAAKSVVLRRIQSEHQRGIEEKMETLEKNLMRLNDKIDLLMNSLNN